MIHHKLKELREIRNETLEDVAKNIGISAQFYWMIENGKRNLSYKLAVKIANHYGVEPDDIFLENYLTKS